MGRSGTDVFENNHRFESSAELLHFARIDASRGDFRDDALEVAHFAELHFAKFAEFGVAEELFHTI